ncbi:mitochondrial outer membrane translocase receptor TOM70, partial [Fistulina hepatica ATCC 64428]
QERTKIAAAFKAKGNAAYQACKFTTAADLYTRAIEVSPKPEPVYYSNRAACYVAMEPSKLELVVEDCTQALHHDPRYIKALNRRALALERLKRYQESLRDYTAATILERFQNSSTAQSVERVLKLYATQEAAEMLASRERKLPSSTFVAAYFAAFRAEPVLAPPEPRSTGDNTLSMAIAATEAGDYAHGMTLVHEALEQGVSWDEGRARALNLRGTYKFLASDTDGAKADFLASIEVVPTYTQTHVKLASIYMEKEDPTKAFACFEDAIKINADDPDIYYHRGQIYFIMGKFDLALENYAKSTSLDDRFVFSQIQHAVAQYKLEKVAQSMALFRSVLKAFPQRSEPHNYYGELLMDQQLFEDAVGKFDRAIEIELNRKSPNVLPLVNKGLTMFQWKQDIASAERCCNEALRLDSECEAAVATLAQLYLQQSRIPEAIEMFDRQAKLSRTEVELVNVLTYKLAAAAQAEFVQNFPDMAAQMAALAQGLQQGL